MKIGIISAIATVMSDGKPWSFWTLQDAIKQRFDLYYGEPSISAGIRALRRRENRKRYGLPLAGEIIIKNRLVYLDPNTNKYSGRAYQYRLITNMEQAS